MKAGWHFEHTYQALPKLFYSQQDPTPVRDPGLVIFNDSLAKSVGLNPVFFKTDAGVDVLAGNLIPKEAKPIAQSYAGHQFGNFTRLGDGRAVLLGEQITPDNRRVDIQYKGSGPTPYSRGGDGRAALGPMLREYIISEAMYGLGIPTSRSLAVATTGEDIQREIEFPGAILTRIASSHIRVGTFEYASHWGEKEDVKALLDYTIKRHEPDCLGADNPYLAFFENVALKQAKLIADWQLVGFIHGVMNTDNVTISGETIDYGPCAFMDAYDPNTVFSSIDVNGRYAYDNQPPIGGWNLARFAEAILPFFDEDEETAVQKGETVLNMYIHIYETMWLSGMRKKLGLKTRDEADESLVNELLDVMALYKADYTNTFIGLTFGNYTGQVVYHTKEFNNWYARWQKRLEKESQTKEEIRDYMKQYNPAIIPRNHRVEEALEAAVSHGDYEVMERLLSVLKNPYEHSEEQKEYAKVPASAEPYRTFCGT